MSRERFQETLKAGEDVIPTLKSWFSVRTPKGVEKRFLPRVIRRYLEALATQGHSDDWWIHFSEEKMTRSRSEIYWLAPESDDYRGDEDLIQRTGNPNTIRSYIAEAIFATLNQALANELDWTKKYSDINYGAGRMGPLKALHKAKECEDPRVAAEDPMCKDHRLSLAKLRKDIFNFAGGKSNHGINRMLERAFKMTPSSRKKEKFTKSRSMARHPLEIARREAIARGDEGMQVEDETTNTIVPEWQDTRRVHMFQQLARLIAKLRGDDIAGGVVRMGDIVGPLSEVMECINVVDQDPLADFIQRQEGMQEEGSQEEDESQDDEDEEEDDNPRDERNGPADENNNEDEGESGEGNENRDEEDDEDEDKPHKKVKLV